jgi:hypothetical protein
LAEARADRLTRAALQLALAHAPGHTTESLAEVQRYAMDLGLGSEETERSLLRLEERGEVLHVRDGWAPRVRAHDATRVQAREQAARAFWGWH